LVLEKVALRVELHLVRGKQAGRVGDSGHLQDVHTDPPTVVVGSGHGGDLLGMVVDKPGQAPARVLSSVLGAPELVGSRGSGS
jgi:hypothetical protein